MSADNIASRRPRRDAAPTYNLSERAITQRGRPFTSAPIAQPARIQAGRPRANAGEGAVDGDVRSRELEDAHGGSQSEEDGSSESEGDPEGDDESEARADDSESDDAPPSRRRRLVNSAARSRQLMMRALEARRAARASNGPDEGTGMLPNGAPERDYDGLKSLLVGPARVKRFFEMLGVFGLIVTHSDTRKTAKRQLNQRMLVLSAWPWKIALPAERQDAVCAGLQMARRVPICRSQQPGALYHGRDMVFQAMHLWSILAAAGVDFMYVESYGYKLPVHFWRGVLDELVAPVQLACPEGEDDRSEREIDLDSLPCAFEVAVGIYCSVGHTELDEDGHTVGVVSMLQQDPAARDDPAVARQRTEPLLALSPMNKQAFLAQVMAQTTGGRGGAACIGVVHSFIAAGSTTGHREHGKQLEVCSYSHAKAVAKNSNANVFCADPPKERKTMVQRVQTSVMGGLRVFDHAALRLVGGVRHEAYSGECITEDCPRMLLVEATLARLADGGGGIVLVRHFPTALVQRWADETRRRAEQAGLFDTITRGSSKGRVTPDALILLAAVQNAYLNATPATVMHKLVHMPIRLWTLLTSNEGGVGAPPRQSARALQIATHMAMLERTAHHELVQRLDTELDAFAGDSAGVRAACGMVDGERCTEEERGGVAGSDGAADVQCTFSAEMTVQAIRDDVNDMWDWLGVFRKTHSHTYATVSRLYARFAPGHRRAGHVACHARDMPALVNRVVLLCCRAASASGTGRQYVSWRDFLEPKTGAPPPPRRDWQLPPDSTVGGPVGPD